MAPNENNLAFLAGVTAAVMGLASMVAAPQLGKLGDKFGSRYVLLFSVFGACLFSIPQAFVQQLWQLIGLRFCMGVTLGGIMPSINVLIRRYAPDGMESRTFSYSNSALFIGGMIGSAGMGAVSSVFGLPIIFICSALLLFINALWIRRYIHL